MQQKPLDPHTVASTTTVATAIAKPAASVPTASTPPPNVGENGTLQYGDSQVVTVGVSEKALDDFVNAAIAHDTMGGKQLYEQGDVFDVATGTKVLVIDYGGGFFGANVLHIRINDGQYVGKDGWIVKEDFQH